VARPELGTKRVCPTTGRKFYDLNKDPIISPYTGQVVTIAAPLLRGARPDVVAPRAVVTPTDEDIDLDPTAEAELISLEEADDETSAAKTVGDEIDVEDDAAPDDDTFLEEDEDESDDVTDLIGDGIEDDEEP
jgi:uncharacterized protein (TIGR02300 family)